jgi:hypothetical protein
MNYTNLAHIITDHSISVYAGGKSYCVSSENINFDPIKVALLEKEFERAIRLMDPNEVINELNDDCLKVVDGKVNYKGDPLHPELEKRIYEILTNGHNLDATKMFLENLYNNPSHNSREQLYDFISHKGMGITEEGLVIGYKGVSEDYMDRMKGTHSNKVGITNTMPRRDVDDNPENGCSHGFHVGSKEYADSWAGGEGHLMAVVWNPRDAVSVPTHSNGEKLRVCEYTVVGEITDRQMYLDKPLYKLTDDGLESIEGDGIVEQEFNDSFYKARNYIETARDNGATVIVTDDLDDRWDLTECDWDDLVFECKLTPDEFNTRIMHL